MFSFLSNCQTIFQRYGTILHSHLQCMRVLIFPYPHQHFLLSFFLIIVWSAVSLWFWLLLSFESSLFLIQILCQKSYYEFFSFGLVYGIKSKNSFLQLCPFIFSFRLNLFSVPTTECCCKDTMVKAFCKFSSTLKSHVLILSYSMQWKHG